MEVWIWLGIIVILSIWEALTVGLVSIWFIASGIVSLILSLFNVDFIICFGVFVILGTILMITTRKYLLKLFKVKNTKTNIDRILSLIHNIDRIIGMKGIVTNIINDSIYEVKVDGKVWSAYSNEELKVNDYVKILEINSVKLKVEKWSDK